MSQWNKSAIGVTQPSLFLDWPFPTPLEIIPRGCHYLGAHPGELRAWASRSDLGLQLYREILRTTEALGPLPVDPKTWSSSSRSAHAIRLALQRFEKVGILRRAKDLYWLQAIPSNWDLLTDGHIDGHPVKAKLGQVLALWGPLPKRPLTHRAGLDHGILQSELWHWCQLVMGSPTLCPTREMAQAEVAAAGCKPAALWERMIDTFGPQFAITWAQAWMEYVEAHKLQNPEGFLWKMIQHRDCRLPATNTANSAKVESHKTPLESHKTPLESHKTLFGISQDTSGISQDTFQGSTPIYRNKRSPQRTEDQSSDSPAPNLTRQPAPDMNDDDIANGQLVKELHSRFDCGKPGVYSMLQKVQDRTRLDLKLRHLDAYLETQNLPAIRNPGGFVLSQLKEPTPGTEDPLWEFAQQAEHTGTDFEATPEDLDRLRACGLGVADDVIVAQKMHDRYGFNYRRLDMVWTQELVGQIRHDAKTTGDLSHTESG